MSIKLSMCAASSNRKEVLSMRRMALQGQADVIFRGLICIMILTGCAPSERYYWGSYEASLIERYAVNNTQLSASYLSQTLLEAEKQQQAGAQFVPPGVYADYGFLLYRPRR